MSSHTPLQTGVPLAETESTPEDTGRPTDPEGSEAPTADAPICPECREPVPVADLEEPVCPSCDVVVATASLSRRRRPAYDARDRDRKRRTGGRISPLYVDGGIGTGGPDGGRVGDDRRGNVESGWTDERTASERRLAYALGEIRRIGAAVGVPLPEREAAARLYRRAAAACCVTGRNADAFVPACLLVAARRSPVSVPVSAPELEAPSRVSERELRTARRALERELDLGVAPMEPREFLPAAVAACGLSPTVREAAAAILEAATAESDIECRGVSPRTLAGAAIHLACDRLGAETTLADLSEALAVDSSTISERKSLLEPYAEAAR
jgi:transcription initiation factor TFIIB